MRTILTVIVMSLSVNAMAASKANLCLNKALKQTFTHEKFSDNVKSLNVMIKECRAIDKVEKKAVSAAKKRIKLQERIAKLKAQLGEG